MNKLYNYAIELVYWRDTTTGPDPNWQDRDYDFHLAHAYSVGFVVREDAETLTLCQSLCYDDPADNPKSWEEDVQDAFIKIPKSIIQERVVLQKAEKLIEPFRIQRI
jgi:hypothetical protein